MQAWNFLHIILVSSKFGGWKSVWGSGNYENLSVKLFFLAADSSISSYFMGWKSVWGSCQAVIMKIRASNFNNFSFVDKVIKLSSQVNRNGIKNIWFNFIILSILLIRELLKMWRPLLVEQHALPNYFTTESDVCDGSEKLKTHFSVKPIEDTTMTRSLLASQCWDSSLMEK